jgi:hypothetical protein
MPILALFIGVGLLLLGALMAVTTLAGLGQSWDGMGVFLLGFFGIVTLAGALLIEFASPGVWRRVGAETASGLTTPATLLHPAAQTAVLFAIGVAAAAVFSRDPVVPVFAVTMFYAVASPAAIAMRPGWWLNATFSALGMLMLFTLFPLAAAAAAGTPSLGETGILMVPILMFPAALAISGMVRLRLARRQRAPSSPA